MLTMFQRIVPVPLEAARMATCVRELEKFSESIPLDITEPHVVHQYLCEHVFHERLPTPIQGPEGDRLTKYDGKLITLRALRDQLLADMDDLVAYVLSPAAEGFRLRAKERLANSSAEWTSSNTSTRGVDRSPSQSFDEQITAVKNHNSNRIQLQSQGETSFAMDIPVNQRRDLKPKATIEEVVTQQNIYVDRYGSPEKNQEGGFEEADTMRKAYVERLRASTVSRAQGHRKNAFSSTAAPNLRTAREQNIPRAHHRRTTNTADAKQERTSAPNPSSEPRADKNAGQTEPQPFLPSGVPAQYQYDAYPGIVFAAPGYHGQMPQIQQPWAQQQWAFQQQAAAFRHPAIAAGQPMTYGYPFWQPTFSEPAPGYLGNQHPMTVHSGYVPPPMPFGVNTIVRPAAGARVAPLFAEKFAPQDPRSAQTRELPTAIIQNTEWQNRYGRQPAVVPDVPVLPYRPGSDTMYPRSTGTASVRFQNLTRDDPPNRHVATAEENVPFAEIARNSQPGKWGVMKVCNVSIRDYGIVWRRRNYSSSYSRLEIFHILRKKQNTGPDLIWTESLCKRTSLPWLHPPFLLIISFACTFSLHCSSARNCSIF